MMFFLSHLLQNKYTLSLLHAYAYFIHTYYTLYTILLSLRWFSLRTGRYSKVRRSQGSTKEKTLQKTEKIIMLYVQLKSQ